MKHDIRFDGCHPHNGEYWYECRVCGKSDWIPRCGTREQLNFYDTPCAGPKVVSQPPQEGVFTETMKQLYPGFIRAWPNEFLSFAQKGWTAALETAGLPEPSTIEEPKLDETRLPVEHELKSDHLQFEEVMRGVKASEVRKADRDFRIGDTVKLVETRHTAEEMKAGAPLLYTGHSLTRTISHIQKGYGLPDDLVVISFERRFRTDSR